jgi:hypothetical protein
MVPTLILVREGNYYFYPKTGELSVESLKLFIESTYKDAYIQDTMPPNDHSFVKDTTRIF